jgi:hypothetical protein
MSSQRNQLTSKEPHPSKMAYGCMLTSVGIARAAVDGRLPGGPDLRFVDLGPDFNPMMELVTGTFARRGERNAFDTSHPINLLWRAFADELASEGTGLAIT